MVRVEADILRHLENHDTWHNDDLTVEIPADSLNVPGSVVARLVNTGQIVEIGRRASTVPERRRATRCRKSGIYRRSGTGGSEVEEASVAACCGPDRSEGDTAAKRAVGESSVGATPAPADPPRLFEIPAPSRYEDAA
jgi:hypothetical protein